MGNISPSCWRIARAARRVGTLQRDQVSQAAHIPADRLLLAGIEGHILYVSADRQQDAKGEPLFLARADATALTGIRGVTLHPGMAAEVLIIDGERTAIDYFLSPITHGIRRSMHEE
jgi:hypothetical protein